MSYNSISFALQTNDVVGFTEPQRNSVELQASISIYGESGVVYKNFKYARYRNFYGYAQIMSGAFVVESIELCYLNQQLLHWQQSATDINQGVGCGVKKILASLTPPVAATVDIYLLRQIYTSIRFKLAPGVAANFNLTWHFPEQLCDETLHFPPPEQGNPPSPNNSGGSPSQRPADQGGDPKDNSPNDGQNPTDGQNPAPAPGGGGGSGTWKVFASAYDLQDRPYTFTWDTQITDRNAIPTVGTVGLGGAGNSAGKGDYALTVNGNRTLATGFGMNVFNPYFSQ